MSRKRNSDENTRWLKEERARRAKAKREAAQQRSQVPGFVHVDLPTLDEELDEVEARGMRPLWVGSELRHEALQ